MGSSIRAIAREIGVNPSTVSRALRGTGNISKEVRGKILQAAEKAGYKVNNLMAQAFSLARQPSGSRYRETLAFIIEFPTETGPDYQKALHAGAEQRAISLAYKLESFILSGRPSEHRRWSTIFRSRGIRGLIIMPRVLHRQPRLHLEWPHFAAVEIGRTLWHPRNLHRVETPEYAKTLETIHLLKKVGYHRIGMAIEPMQNFHQNGVYYAAYLLTQQKVPPARRVPIFALDGGWSEKNFHRWMRRYKPEVLIVHSPVEICPWVLNLGLSIPRDVSIFRFSIRNDDPWKPGAKKDYQWSGLIPDQLSEGHRAVDMLNNLLERGETGLTGNPLCLQCGGFWTAGKTLNRPINAFISEEGFLKTALPRSNFRI